MVYVEKNCIIEHNGKQFESGGAIVTPDWIVAYPAAGGVLTDWHGERIGTWKAVASWPIRSYMGSTMFQIESRVNDVVYTGRGFGLGCVYRGKRKACQNV